MLVDLDNSSTASGEASVSSSGNEPPPPKSAAATAKKKRNLPGMPDPDAEVIALSPKTLLATNRFVCEICSKGFQRDQNLQLHRKGHNSYCVWTPKKAAKEEANSFGRCKKSGSTGSNSKRWKIRAREGEDEQ